MKINKVPHSKLSSKLRERVHVPVWTLESIASFGKYKGDGVVWIIRHDVDYVEWMLSQKVITLDERAHELYCDVLCDAIEKNAIHNRQFDAQEYDLPF